MSQITIIAGIIVLIGSFVVLNNIVYFYFKGLFQNIHEVIRHVIAGIGAAILAPILFKSLVTSVPDYSNVEFLVISGLCFVGGYLSDRFINCLGKNILIGFRETKSKVDKRMPSVKEKEAKQNFTGSNEVEQNTSKLESIDIENESKIILSHIDMKVQEDKIIKSFSEKKKIRTAREIAVELDANSIVINDLLEGLHGQGKLKKLTCLNGNVHWALTQLGISMINSEN